MSIRAVEAAILTDAPTASAKAVMVALGYSHNQETGLCCPGRLRIAQLSGLKTRTIYDAIKALVEADPPLIRVVERRRADKTRTSDSYVLLFATPEAIQQRISDDIARAALAIQEDGNDPDELVADFANSVPGASGGFRKNDPTYRRLAPDLVAPGATQGKGKVKGEEETAPSKPADFAKELAAKLWGLAPDVLKERWTDSDKRKLIVALNSALGAGDDPNAILAGLARYFQIKERAGEIDEVKTINLLVATRLWEKWLPREFEIDNPAPKPAAAALSLGTADTPTEELQVRWMRGYVDYEPRIRDDFWPADKRGPPPGAPGCRVDPAIQRRFGVRPFEDLNREGEDDGTD